MKYFILNIILVSVVNFADAKFKPGEKLTKNDSAHDVYVSSIIIAGNEVTDDDVIRREIHTTENSKLDPVILQEDVERIYKLGLFNKVQVFPVPTDTVSRMKVMFLVEERFYILPMPQGGFRNGELSKFWAGARITWNNFRGRNETASLSFGVFYEPFVNMSYHVPWIGREAHFFSSASIGFSKNYNRSLIALNDTVGNTIPSTSDNFAIYDFKASYSLGKFFTKDLSASTSLRYHIMETSQFEPGRTVSPDGKDNYFTFSAYGRLDTRNSTEYTLSGSFYTIEYEKFGFAKLMDFNRVSFESRKFIPIKLGEHYGICFATRTLGAISFGGTIPTYLNEFFGYNNIIRGHKKQVMEGENKLGLFNEIRIPVIDPFYFEGKEMPVINKISLLKNLSYKFGLYATLFFDVGGVWNKNDNLFKTQFRNGYGVGLNFILPFGFVGRTDFAFRKEGKRFVPQVVFDLDAAF